MSPPDNTSRAARISRWLDWWFTPRWRALLTWIVCSGIGGLVWGGIGGEQIWAMIDGAFNFAAKLSPLPLPRSVPVIAFLANTAFLIYGIEPFALRLSPGRGAAWLGLRIGAVILYRAFSNIAYDFSMALPLNAASTLPASVAMAAVLYRWRTRPWMTIIAAAFSIAAWQVNDSMVFRDSSLWWWSSSCALSFAAVMIYGTRLLRPEERVPGFQTAPLTD